MTVIEILRELEELLQREEEALIAIRLEEVLAQAGRKAELVEEIELLLGEGSDQPLPADARELARKVHSKAQKNQFLLQHLRSCLSLVNPIAKTTQTYGRDGRTASMGGASTVRVRL